MTHLARRPATPTREPIADDIWNRSATEVLESVHSGRAGLSGPEAARRLAAYGPNRLDERPRERLFLNFLSRFRNPLVLVLLAAAAASAATGDPMSFVIIVIIIALSVVLDFVQEHRAQIAAERLRRQVAVRALALRDGAPCEVATTEIVPGDVIMLAAGDLAPADCYLLEAKDLFVNEALLTGEAYPAEKTAAIPARQPAEPASVPANAVFMGSSVVSGSAKALVVHTGRETQLGGIAHSLQREPAPTAFAVGIRDFGLLIVRLTVLLVLFVLFVNLMFHRPLIESFLFALALAVGLTPELLPMVVTVTLAHGALRMAEKKVIVKRLSAINDLGGMDILCSDKTGTLTEARITLVREVDLAGRESRHVLELAYLNAAFETGLKSPLDEAILASERLSLEEWKKIDEVPFDFERRRVSVLAEKDGERRLIVKGAPESILSLASHYQRAGEREPALLDDAARQQAENVFNGLGKDGFRVLGVAWRDVEPERSHAEIGDEANLVFAGFAAFLDPPKSSAGPAVAALAQLGVAVKVVTGDNEHITRHICEALKIPVAGILTGSELAELSDDALMARLAHVNLLCRISPSQKARVIRALRRQGHVVGYVGDGINDALSLQAADVGLSVENAVDVAKDAAAMILLEKDLGVLADGVREGRRTFANIMKYVMMGTSSNFGNMFSMAGGVLLLPFLPMLPIQILLNNLLYDLSEAVIPMDRVDEDSIARPRHWDMRFVRNFMLALGPVSSLFDFLTFGLLLFVFDANAALFHTGWFVESLATQTLVVFVIRTRGNPLKSRPHPWLVLASLIALGLGVGIPFTIAGAWLGLVPPPPLLLLALAGTTALYLVTVEGAKRWFYASVRGPGYG